MMMSTTTAATGSRTRLQSTRALRTASDCSESSPDSSSRRSAEPVEDRVSAACTFSPLEDEGPDESWVSTGSTSAVSVASGDSATGDELLGMAADLLSQPGGDDPGQLSGKTGVGTVFFGDFPFLHHAAGPGGEQEDALAQADRLADVVGHKDDGASGFLPDALKFVVQQVAGDGVQGRERLIHQQQLAVLRERAGQGHALAHAAGQFVRAPVRGFGEVDQVQQLCSFDAPLGLADAAQLQCQLDVLAGGEPWEQGGVLEHEGGAVAGHFKGARRRELQSRHDVQQGGLAAAGRTEEGDELALADGGVDVVQHRGAFAEALAQVFQYDWHGPVLCSWCVMFGVRMFGVPWGAGGG